MEELSNNPLNPVVFKTSDGYVYYSYRDIIVCSADGNNALVFDISNNTPIKILHTLSYIEERYCNDKLIRCHRSHIINLAYLKKLFKRSHQALMRKGFRVPLSDEWWEKLCKISENEIQ
jgi:DNA-binding LytR/AlgR family response regulator